ncbi:MAG: fumarylacetoacetate hydrolase family protein, partial [Pseudomonadota bacterium]
HWNLFDAGPEERIPVRNIYAIGWNYPLHNRELSRRPDEPPVVFMKSGGSLIFDGGLVPFPPHTQEMHYEGELVVLIGQEGYRVPEAEAMKMVWGYAPGIDFTLRDLQRKAKEKGQPWYPAKNFAGAAAVGVFRPAAQVGDYAPLRLELFVNGARRQDSLLSAMNHGVAELIAALSANLPLLRGDAIFTGTPQGVGECREGDSVECLMERVGRVTAAITPWA